MDYPKYLACTACTWAGCVSAISFMEAWLKFRAPGVTQAIGLGIGKLVFRGLNTMEWGFALASAGMLWRANLLQDPRVRTLSIPIAALALQSAWLLPALTARADAIIGGAKLPRSPLHIYFGGAELLKVGCLIGFAVQMLSTQKDEE